MLDFKLAVLATLLSAVLAENRLYRYEIECKVELKSSFDRCQRACELEKLGMMRNGRFDLREALMKVDEEDGLTLYPSKNKLALKKAMVICSKEVNPLEAEDKCTAAAAIYYCLHTFIRPEILYRSSVRESYKKKPVQYSSCQRRQSREYQGRPSRYQKDANNDIISEKSLQVVKEIIHFLKEHAREEGLFRHGGRRDVRRQILNSLRKGEKVHFESVENVALECAAALQLFLTQLKKPVMPQHVQELILADNPGVTARTIAQDALGLIRQDVGGRHGVLLSDLLDLLKHLTFSGPPSERSELRGSPVPIALLPVFFSLTPTDLIKWKQVATRFSELITEAPEQLRTNETPAVNAEYAWHSVENDGNMVEDEFQQLTRLQEFSVLEPIIRLTNNYNVYQVGEMAQVLAAPLYSPTAGRLHPAISTFNR